MRFKDIIETPLTDYQPIGDFEKPGSFTTTKYDPKLAVNPVNIKKAFTFFENTNYDFRIYPVNKPGLRKYSEHGRISPEELLKILPEAESILRDPKSEDSITIFYVSNVGAEKVPFTPWIMAHRMGHVLRKDNWNWDEYYVKPYKRLLVEVGYMYGLNNVDLMSAPAVMIANTIGTMKSARNNRITRPYEFLYELLAQYLNSKDNSVKFNPIPRVIQSRRGILRCNESDEVLTEFNELLRGMHTRDLNYAIESILGASLNAIYLM